MEEHDLPDTLSFRFQLKRGAGFRLDVEERLPLKGITAITGPSGSGKTTILRGLAGLDEDVRGSRYVRFAGNIWDDERIALPPEERRIGMVFQEPALFPHLSVAGNIGYGARRRQIKSTDAIIDALNLGPMMSREVTGLSGGEARRVALARALASDPALLLLDEPMSGLDALRKTDFLPYIARAVAAAQVPTIYVTHAADEVISLADRVLDLKDGKSVGWQTPPMRLTGRVAGAGEGGVIVSIDGGADGSVGASLVVHVRALIGERIGLGLSPDAIQISAQHPGEGSALTVLPAHVAKSDETHLGIGTVLKVLGQELKLPPSVKVPLGHSNVWLSILRVYPRPQLADSGV